MDHELRTLTRDPVCGAELDTLETAVLASYEGELFAFCCYGCLNAFSENPDAYVAEGSCFACEPLEPAPFAN